MAKNIGDWLRETWYVILIVSALLGVGTFIGMARNTAEVAEENENRIDNIERAQIRQAKDIEYVKSGIDEIKTLLKEGK